MPSRAITGEVERAVLNKIAELTEEIVKLQKKNDKLPKLTVTFTVVAVAIALISFSLAFRIKCKSSSDFTVSQHSKGYKLLLLREH